MNNRSDTPRGSVLLVEDNADIREALQEMLADEGIAVASARDGSEALAYLKAQPRPDAILLDWRMPVMDGERFLLARAQAGVPMVPVVVLSADRGEIERATALGVAAYVAKPVDIEFLLRTLERFMPARA